jgi:hypothetical protein
MLSPMPKALPMSVEPIPHDGVRQRVLDIYAHGLIANTTGSQARGNVCAMSAIAWANNENHGDTSACVHAVWRALLVTCNDDVPWVSPTDRATSLLPLALAAVHTAEQDQTGWLQHFLTNVVRHIIPLALRAAKLDYVYMTLCAEAQTFNAVLIAVRSAGHAVNGKAVYAVNATANVVQTSAVRALRAAVDACVIMDSITQEPGRCDMTLAPSIVMNNILQAINYVALCDATAYAPSQPEGLLRKRRVYLRLIELALQEVPHAP